MKGSAEMPGTVRNTIGATVLVAPFFLPGAAMIAAYAGLWGAGAPWRAFEYVLGSWWWLGGCIMALLLHEGLQALAAALLANAPVSALRIGVKLNPRRAYADLPSAMSVEAFRAVLAAPVLLMGLMVFAYAAVSGADGAIVFAVVSTLIAAPDLLILWMIRRLPGSSPIDAHPHAIAVKLCEPAAPR